MIHLLWNYCGMFRIHSVVREWFDQTGMIHSRTISSFFSLKLLVNFCYILFQTLNTSYVNNSLPLIKSFASDSINSVWFIYVYERYANFVIDFFQKYLCSDFIPDIRYSRSRTIHSLQFNHSQMNHTYQFYRIIRERFHFFLVPNCMKISLTWFYPTRWSPSFVHDQFTSIKSFANDSINLVWFIYKRSTRSMISYFLRKYHSSRFFSKY